MSQFSNMAQAGQRLVVNVIQAEGLQHLNNFTGDHPYVYAEVKHLDPHATRTTAETQPVKEGDTINPVWNETLELERWQPGEALEFTIYDKGLIGSKTEGKALLPSEYFYPNGFRGMISVVGLPDARLRLEVPPPAGFMMPGQGSGMAPMPVTYEAPATSQYAAPTSSVYGTQAPAMSQYAAPTSSVYGTQQMAPTSSTYGSQQIMVPTMAQAAGPHKLAVSILQAHGLQQMNNFTGDHPYVVCEVKHLDSSRTTKVETKPVTEGDTLNPFWGETHTLGPWHEGEPLEFTVYDKGLIGSKTEGKVLLGPELFFPNGFSGMLSISGLPHSMLHVIIRPLGSYDAETSFTEGLTESKKKKKKVKIGKKSKGCC
jgi:hypothetical protein